jgi:hypothetical protein
MVLLWYVGRLIPDRSFLLEHRTMRVAVGDCRYPWCQCPGECELSEIQRLDRYAILAGLSGADTAYTEKHWPPTEQKHCLAPLDIDCIAPDCACPMEDEMYFGYYANGAKFLGPVEDGGNLRWLQEGEIPDRPSICSVTGLLFNHPSTVLRPDAKERLVEWFSKLPDPTLVKAVLLFDEPWKLNENNKLKEDTTGNLDKAAFLVKALTGFKTCVSEGGKNWVKNKIPANVDWLGMYSYSYNTYRIELSAYYTVLAWAKNKNQKIMAVVDAFENIGVNLSDPRTLKQTEDRIIAHNNVWKALCKYSDVVAVCPFLYQNAPFGYGAASLPRVRAQLAQWCAEIVSTA